jgi:hypothetical protein
MQRLVQYLLHKESNMGRSTFDGPILSGDQRFGPQRDLGFTDLVQSTLMDFSQTNPATFNDYSGSSGTFVTSSKGPQNTPATIWVPQYGTYSQSGPVVCTSSTTPPSPYVDGTTANTIYRGVVFLIPFYSNITDIIVDVGAMPVDSASHTATSIQPYVSNAFVSSSISNSTPGLYGTSAAITGIGRTNITYAGAPNSTYYPGTTSSQLGNTIGTFQDVQNIQPGQQPTWFSQVVVTFAISATTFVGPTTSGLINTTIRYQQPDIPMGNGNPQYYPYGNPD